MKRFITLFFGLLVSVLLANGQTMFRSNGTGGGPWTTLATWQQFNGLTWVAASSTPNSSSGSIEIQLNDIVTVSAPLTINGASSLITVDPSATLTATSTLTIGGANELTVNGTLSVTGAGVISSPSSLDLIINGTYTHARNTGTIPTATWNTGSLCNITGTLNTAGVPGGLNQSFYNVTWNCTQTGVASLAGNLTSIGSTFTISKTNGFALELATNQTPTITIGDSLVVQGSSILAFVTATPGSATINVGGNFSYYSTAISPLATTGNYTLTIGGNFNMNSTGTLRLATGAGGVGTVNLSGNFNLTSGTLTRTNGTGVLNFVSTGTQTFINTGTISSTINTTVGSAGNQTITLDMKGESWLGGGGTFDLWGTIRLGSVLNATGALITGAGGGNIRITGVRTYHSGSNVVYAGLSAQVMGNGNPGVAGSGVTTIIDNVANVTNSGAVTVNDLKLTNGSLSITSNSLTINGNVTPNSNTISISGASLIINGSGSFGNFPFPAGAQSIVNFTLNRTPSGSVTFVNPMTITGALTITNGTATFGNTLTVNGATAVNGGSITLGGTTTLTGAITLATGTVLAFDGQSLTTGNNFTATGTGALSASGASTLTMNSGANITPTLAFLGTNNTLQSFTMNYTNASGTIHIGSLLNITNTLTLTDGTLDIPTAGNLNMSSGSTINLAATGATPSTITTNGPSGGPWNLNYSSTAAKTTGLEIPSSGSPQLLSLSTSNTNTITLSQPLTIGSGGFTITAGAFTCGANAVSSSSVTITAGTFTAPSSTLTLTGDLTVTGVYTNNSGSLIFNGTSTIHGAAATNFFAVTINNLSTLTGPSTFNIQSNFANNGTFTAGTNTVNFSGGNVQTVTGNDAQFYNLTVNKAGGSLTINASETVTNNLTLIAGTFNISSPVSVTSASSTVTLTAGTMAISSTLTLASGATISRAAGIISTNSPSGGPWNLIYTGGTKTTGLEIPSSGNVSSVTLNTNNGSTVTLLAGQALNVSGAFTITSSGRTFTSGANNVTVGSLSNAGTFNASTAAATVGLTFNGNFSNSGTFNNQSGTVLINAPVSITGTVPTLFGLTVTSSGVFTAPATLTVQGNLQNDGTFNASASTITLSGNTSKNIQGLKTIAFNNLTISGSGACHRFNENTAGLTLSGVLKFTSAGGNPTFDTDGASNNKIFTLLSTADYPTTADASVGVLANGPVQMPGKVTVQRHMGREGDPIYNYQVWRNISSPVNVVVDSIQKYLPVTGPFAHASVVSGADATYSSMEDYNETVITDTNLDGIADLNDGWTDFPTSVQDSYTTSFARGAGYSIFIFGSDPPVSTNNGANWQLTGPIWSGTFNMPVTCTFSGSGGTTYVAANDGWNLVGNPYPSTIDWKAGGAAWTKTNIDDAIYMSDYRTANPVFASYVNGIGANNGSQYIATGQGFWVKANAAAPVLTITENVKVPGQPTIYFRQAAPSNLLRVTLSDGTENDETVIYFSDSTTLGFDRKYDAWKMRNPYWYLNLSSQDPVQKDYSINARPFSNCAQIVPLNVYDVTSGNYSLSFSQLESFSPSMKIQLKDNFTNSVVDVRQTSSYPFTVNQNNPLTFGANRFSLSFTYQGSNVALIAPKTAACDSTLAVVTVKNSSSDFNYTVLSSTNGSVIVPATSGTGSDLNLLIPKSAIVQGLNLYQLNQVNKYCSTFAASVSDTLNFVLPPVAPTAASTSSCGQGTVTLTASGAPTGGHYNWYDSLSSTAFPVTTSTFVTQSLAKSKTYYVSATNSVGCEGVQTPILANVINLDSATITVVNLSTLQSNYASGNQWYLNGQAISGAVSQQLKPTQSGNYTVGVTAQGCTIFSPVTSYVVTGVESPPAGGIKVYPVPVSGMITIEVPGSDIATGEILNIVGSSISTLGFSSNGENQIAKYNFSKESSGIYMIRIFQGEKVSVVRIVKD